MLKQQEYYLELFTVVPNHDSFMFDECYTDTIVRLVRELYVELLEGNVLYGLITQINTAKVKETGAFLEREKLTVSDIMASMRMKLEA